MHLARANKFTSQHSNSLAVVGTKDCIILLWLLEPKLSSSLLSVPPITADQRSALASLAPALTGMYPYADKHKHTYNFNILLIILKMLLIHLQKTGL